MKRVYLVVVNWNGWMDTIECLESLFRLEYPNYRVIICDNGSTDDSLSRLVDWAEGQSVTFAAPVQSYHHGLTDPPVEKPLSYVVYDRTQAEEGGDCTLDPRLIIIRTGGNLGFAGGNNIGLRYALVRGDFEHVWLLNNDTVVEPLSLKALVTRMSEKPSAGMCGSTLVFYDKPDRVQARGGGWYCKWIGLPWHIGQYEKARTRSRIAHVEKWMNYVVGASMLVSREFLSSVGLMSEDYFLYFEEADWALRGTPAFTLAYAPESIVYHKVGASVGTSSDPRKKSMTCDYYSIRNRIRFTKAHFPVALLTVYPTLCLAILNRLVLGQWRRGLMILGLILARGKDLKAMKPMK
jgi:GT2 family glycosyltransferase